MMVPSPPSLSTTAAMLRQSSTGAPKKSPSDLAHSTEAKSEEGDDVATLSRLSSHTILTGSGVMTKRHDDTDDDEDDDSDNDPTSHSLRTIANTSQAKAKREKRLAMNRASARERRRRKRVLLEKLEERVLELTKRNTALQEVNEGLQNRVQRLEIELARSNQLVTTLMGSSSNSLHGGPTGLDTSSSALVNLLGNAVSSTARQHSSAAMELVETERVRQLLGIAQGVAGRSTGALPSVFNTASNASKTASELLREALAERHLLQAQAQVAQQQQQQQQQRRNLLASALGGGVGASGLSSSVSDVLSHSQGAVNRHSSYGLLSGLIDSNSLATSGMPSRLGLGEESKLESFLTPPRGAPLNPLALSSVARGTEDGKSQERGSSGKRSAAGKAAIVGDNTAPASKRSKGS